MDSHALKSSATHASDSLYAGDIVKTDVDGLAENVDFDLPANFHRFHHDKSILALAVTSTHIYAGTQGGEILVFVLKTYERVSVIDAHDGSVLGLALSQDERLLFSSAGDRFVNVWDALTLKHFASIYSVYDIGDIFCVSYSSRLETVYLGSQNTSIQWYTLRDYTSRPPPNPGSHPALRHDRFFDSPGPGGIRTPRRQPDILLDNDVKKGRNLEIDKNHIQQFAHFGYVYCMLLTRGPQSGLHRDEVLISGGGDGVIKLWGLDEEDGGRISELGILDDGREGGDSVLTIILDGTFLYSGRVAGEINVWDLETRQLVRTLKAHDQDILTLSVGYGNLFAAAVNGTVTKFDQRHESLGEWHAHQGMVLASAFTTCNGQPIYATGGNDSSIALWDVRDCVTFPAKITQTSHEQLLDSLRRFISFRSVSSDPLCKADCRRAASWLRSLLKQFGATTELIKTDDGCNPIVFARFRSNAATVPAKHKRILFYGHYDVVRAENKKDGLWRQDPFTMEGMDGYLYGRGTSDNKGPIMAAIYAVAELVSQQALESDIVFLLEGEEECGSRGFKQAIHRSRSLVGPVDWILLANSYWLDDEVPCLTYGLRGVIHATVEIQSDEPDLHSGVDGSRLLDEPLKDLVTLLGRLNGRHGKVEIPGFYDDILPITEHEKLLYNEIVITLLERDPSLGNTETLTTSLIERWANATLTLHGFKISGPQNSTIIPRHAQATLSMRLVPNQEVNTIAFALVQFLNNEFARLQSKNHLTVTIGNQAEPWLGDYTNELFQTLEQAVMEVWSASNNQRRPSISGQFALGKAGPDRRQLANPKPATSSTLANVATSPVSDESFFSQLDDALSTSTSVEPKLKLKPRKPLYIREGGSIPAIRFLEKEFQAPAAHFPCGQASDNAHLDNERFRILNLYNSKAIFRKVFSQLPGK